MTRLGPGCPYNLCTYLYRQISSAQLMNPYGLAIMFAAITCELVGTTALKLANGGSQPWWYVAVAIGYGLAFVLFSHALRTIPLGVAYAIWAGMGIVGTALIGVMLFRQQLSWLSILGIGVILTGVVLLNLGSSPLAGDTSKAVEEGMPTG